MVDLAARPRTPATWIALLGNPNVGKSALFNALTGLRQKVANYPGVTVERREGTLRPWGRSNVHVLDLPGINSLVARSPDELIAAEVLTGRQASVPLPSVVVMVMAASQVRRGLFLLSQVLECGLPVVVCLNMADEARREGLPLDRDGLSIALNGVPVLTTVGPTGEGVRELASVLANMIPPPPKDLIPTIPGVHGLPPPSPERWRQLREAVDEGGLEDSEIQARWRWVGRVLEGVRLAQTRRARERSDRLDRLLLHPILGPSIFLVVMAAVFQAVFGLASGPMDLIEASFQWMAKVTHDLLGAGFLADFLADGIVAGVGSVLVFLPQILILFLFLGLLEDSGYLTRAAFLADRPLRMVGLSGRAFIPLLSSFACAVPGIMATRSIEDPRERRLTLLVAPLMTCSARLPVYTILIGAFIPRRQLLGFLSLQGLTLLALYLFGLILGALAALVMDRILRRSGSVPAVTEFPPYRLPRLQAVALRLWQRGGIFLRRAGTVILAMAVLIWVLVSFPRVEPKRDHDRATMRATQISQSLAGQFGHLMEPAIRPLGYDWRIGIGLISSLAAREVFVSTMGVVYAAEDSEDSSNLVAAMRGARWEDSGKPVYPLATVVSLLIFFAVALQCVSTLAVIYRETGSIAWTMTQLGGLTTLAYVLALAAYQGLASLGLG